MDSIIDVVVCAGIHAVFDFIDNYGQYIELGEIWATREAERGIEGIVGFESVPQSLAGVRLQYQFNIA